MATRTVCDWCDKEIPDGQGIELIDNRPDQTLEFLPAQGDFDTETCVVLFLYDRSQRRDG